MSKKIEDEFYKIIQDNYNRAENRIRLKVRVVSVSNVAFHPFAINSIWRRSCIRLKVVGLVGMLVPGLILIWGTDYLLPSNIFLFLCLLGGMVLGACFLKLVENMEKELGFWSLKFSGWSKLLPKFEWHFLSPHEYKTLRS